MNIKRFFAPDTRQAMQQVRKTLGADAVIISNRQTDDGVEIIAALEIDAERLANTASKIAPRPKKKPSPKAPEAAPDQVTVTPMETNPEENKDGTIERMNSEINRLRDLLENQITSMNVGQWTKNSPIRIKLYNQLTKVGLEPSIVTNLLGHVDDADDLPTASRKVMGMLTQQIRSTEETIISEGGVVILVGPSGSGKTTTLAKLAAQFIMENSTRDVVFISADNSRVGAHEQLLAYGRLFGIPVLRAREDSELEEIIAATADKRLVLVDRGSLTAQQMKHPELIPTMGITSLPLKHYLVLPATLQLNVMGRLLNTFSRANIQGCILSKVDEANSLGDVLTAFVRSQFPLTYLTDGQRVTAHLHPAHAKDLIARALQLVKDQEESLRNEAMAISGHANHNQFGLGY